MGGGPPPPGIPPPQAPKPATPPSVPVTDFKGQARRLAKQLKAGKRDEVLRAVQALSPSDRKSLDAVLIPIFEKDPLRPQGIELRRILRFFGRKIDALPTPDTFTVSGGTEVKLTKNELTKSTKVSAKTGVKASIVRGTNIAYSVTYTGPNTSDTRWLQMIWRDAVLNYPASGKDTARSVALKMRFDHLGRPDMPYYLSTDPERAKKPEKCRWHGDSPSGKTPFYDGAVRRLANELTMVDDPSPTLTEDQARAFLTGTNPPESVVSGFHAETYLVSGMDVLYRVKIDITWKSTKAVPKLDGTIVITGAPASEISAPQRARLAVQNPEIDYLPGPLIGPPLMSDDLDPIADLKPGEWAALKTDAEKLVAVADVANVGMVPYATATNSPKRVVNPKGRVAGLNFDDTLEPKGETGYIDSTLKFHNPDMPVGRIDPLPLVAMIVGKKAFHSGSTDFPKEAAVGTMRDEMQHGLQDTYAIGWLVKWRDDFTADEFGPWLAKQSISTPDRLVVKTGLTRDLDAIDALALTEGFIAVIPFLPTAVDVDLLTVKEQWPAALRELFGAGKFYLQLNGMDKDRVDKREVQPVVRDRIRRYVCGFATQAERDTLIRWLKAMLAPEKIVPTPDKRTIALVTGFFAPQSQWLKEVLDVVTKPCPK